MSRRRAYGLLAEFDTPEHLIEAAHRVHGDGYRQVDAFTPFPVEGLSEAIGFHHTRLPLVVFLGGLLGGLGGFFMQYYAHVIAYPQNIGGHPLNSWPSFVPITFELTVLGAAFSAVLGMLAMNGLPMPHHPLFNEPRFALASRDRFFLCVKAKDRKYDRDATRRLLESLGPRQVSEVER